MHMHSRGIFSISCIMKLCCVYVEAILKSIHNIPFSIMKKKITKILSQICSYGIFFPRNSRTSSKYCFCCCVVVLRPRKTSRVMSGRSVNLTTLFLSRLRPPKRLNQYFVPLLNQRTEKRKYVARQGIEPRTSDLRVRCPTDCTMLPGMTSK